jgi:nucleotide-binding universal stress UspA family protein
METDPGSAFQPMSFAASKEWFKLLAHRSHGPYETTRGDQCAWRQENQRVAGFLHIKKLERTMSWLNKQSVLVPIDFSEESLKALDVAAEFVQDPAKIHVIHVTRPWSEHEIGGAWGQESEEERIRSLEQRIQEMLKGKNCSQAEVAIRIGSPPAEIAGYAEEAGAELIVMPSHGRTGIQHFTLGSVAERVVRIAHCPVLVLRRADHKKQPSKKIISYD